MHLKRLKRITIALGLLLMFIAYEFSLTMFTHVHVVNGFLVVHSHPSSEGHTHGAKQLITIACLHTFDSEEATTFTFSKPVDSVLCTLEREPDTVAELIAPPYSYPLRAPPVNS